MEGPGRDSEVGGLVSRDWSEGGEFRVSGCCLVAEFSIFCGSRLGFARVVCLPVDSGFGGAVASAGVGVFWSGEERLVAGAPLCRGRWGARFWPSRGRGPPGPLKPFYLFILRDRSLIA